MIEVLKKYNYWADEEIQSGYYRAAYIRKEGDSPKSCPKSSKTKLTLLN